MSIPAELMDSNARIIRANNIRTRQKDVAIVGGVVDINLQEATTFRIPLTADITSFNIYAESAPGFVTELTLLFVADGTARTVAWPAGVAWPGGTPPSIPYSAGATTSIHLDTSDGGVSWSGYVQSSGASAAASAPLVWTDATAKTASALVAGYEAEQTISVLHGPRNFARPGYVKAANAITLSPSSDPVTDATDPATLVVDTLTPNSLVHNDPIPDSLMSSRMWRGGNPNLKKSVYAGTYYINHATGVVGAAGNGGLDTTIDPGLQWGVWVGSLYLDFTLSGDVFYFRNSQTFPVFIEVDGALIQPTSTDPSIVVDESGIAFSRPSGNVPTKVKFASSATRRIRLGFGGQVSTKIYTRATSTITFDTAKAPRWLMFGDSIAFGTVSDSGGGYNASTVTYTRLPACSTTMMYEFGGEFDFINASVGSTGFYAGVKPFEAPVSGNSAAIRKELLLTTKGLDADIITVLSGANDASYYNNPVYASEIASFIRDARTMHPNALIALFGSSTGLSGIASGADVNVENVLAQVCAQNGALHIPLQTTRPPYLRGTGKQGSVTGDGNTEILIGSDGTHPTIEGHKTLGRLMARRLYEALRG